VKKYVKTKDVKGKAKAATGTKSGKKLECRFLNPKEALTMCRIWASVAKSVGLKQ